MRKRSQQLGYTSVEVLIAMTLFAIGAAGVIGMQRVSVQGNADARRTDIGTQIAGQWMARLRRDSMSWTQPNAIVTTSNLTFATTWLRETASLPTPLGANTGWRQPLVPASPIGGSYAFDVLGREVVPGAPETFYCVNYRLDWLVLNETIRAEVRVFWPRLESNPAPSCAPAEAEVGNAQQLYHFVYGTTTVRRNAT